MKKFPEFFALGESYLVWVMPFSMASNNHYVLGLKNLDLWTKM